MHRVDYGEGGRPKIVVRNIGSERSLFKKKVAGETNWRFGEEIDLKRSQGEVVVIERSERESRYSRMRRLGFLIGGGNAARAAAATAQPIIAAHLASRNGTTSGIAVSTPENAEENIIKLELFFLEVLPTSAFSLMLSRWDEQHFRPLYQQATTSNSTFVDRFDGITEVEFDIMIETVKAGFDMV